ncbi:MAG: nucleotide exchange factor GrpE [Candidatus Woesearchaeota archaeon]
MKKEIKEEKTELNNKKVLKENKADKESDKERLIDNGQVQELTNLLQRVQADFENYKKRTDEEKTTLCKYASEELLMKILPIVDHFELALNHKDNKEEFVKGIELIYSQLIEILEKEGLRPIKAIGEKFDPHIHEALMSEKSEEEDNKIIEEFQKGYKLGEKIIRHSKVKVAKKS